MEGLTVPPLDIDSAIAFPSPSTDYSNPLSARSIYIDGCIRDGLVPLSKFAVRKNVTKSLSLKSQGMGNKMARVFAESIHRLPLIHSLNLADNNLTDDGISYIMKSLKQLSTLTELDLSVNTVGNCAAKTLGEYISSPDCPLVKLRLHQADVDDLELAAFVHRLHTNKNLTELDVSNNFVGNAENLNTVIPDVVTGAEAFATLLRLPNCALQSLNLSWNMIRLDGAMDMVNAIGVNSSLTYLDLSFNSLGHDGGLALGDALTDNMTLQTLLIANNNIDSMAAFAICALAMRNLALKKIDLSGNPIGELGSRAATALPLSMGQRMAAYAHKLRNESGIGALSTVSREVISAPIGIVAVGCNLQIRDTKKASAFNPDLPCTQYELLLSNPYDRAIAFYLLYIASTHHTYNLKNVTWDPLGGKSSDTEEIILVHHVFNCAAYLDSKASEIIAMTERIIKAASNKELAKQLFDMVDEDKTGELDSEELQFLLGQLGIDLGLDAVEDIVAQFDVDGGGIVDQHDFFMVLKSLAATAHASIHNLTDTGVMMRVSKDHIDDPSQGEYFTPPKEGILKIELYDAFIQKSLFKTFSVVDTDSSKTMALNGSSDAEVMFTHILTQGKLKYNEGLELYADLFNQSKSKLDSLVKILLAMENGQDARRLCEHLLKGDNATRRQLKQCLGQLLRPVLGNYNGYYVLDMKKSLHRQVVSRLLTHSMTTNAVRQKYFEAFGGGRLGDLSQCTPWSSFRNELYNGKPIRITPESLKALSNFGTLEFDYSTVERADEDIEDLKAISDTRFLRVLRKFGLYPTAFFDLQEGGPVEEGEQKDATGDGTTVLDEESEESDDGPRKLHETTLIDHCIALLKDLQKKGLSTTPARMKTTVSSAESRTESRGESRGKNVKSEKPKSRESISSNKTSIRPQTGTEKEREVESRDKDDNDEKDMTIGERMERAKALFEVMMKCGGNGKGDQIQDTSNASSSTVGADGDLEKKEQKKELSPKLVLERAISAVLNKEQEIVREIGLLKDEVTDGQIYLAN